MALEKILSDLANNIENLSDTSLRHSNEIRDLKLKLHKQENENQLLLVVVNRLSDSLAEVVDHFNLEEQD